MGKTSEAEKRAARKYKRENTLQVNVTINKNTDPLLFEYVERYEGNRAMLFRLALKRMLGLSENYKFERR